MREPNEYNALQAQLRTLQPCHHNETLTGLGELPTRKTKDVVEMLGDFLREAAVLVPVFFLLEYSLKYDGNLPVTFVLAVCGLSLFLLTLGIVCEKLR